MDTDSRLEHLPIKILTKGGSAEIVEKKSRFIATLGPAADERTAEAFLEEVKKKYWDARHNCYAYVVGERGELKRCSDDKEPAGTAGKPMLKVLQDMEIYNAVLVVTRYFGGTLLGTGGLVRAYTQAAQAGIAASRIDTMRYGVELSVTSDYNMAERMRRRLELMELEPAGIEYSEVVRMTLRVPWEKQEMLCRSLTELTAGKLEIRKISEKYFIDK